MIELRELMLRESEQVEWKENVADVNDVVRTLVAFANDLANLGGGRVVCGAAEGRDEHGFPQVKLEGMTADRVQEVRGKVVARCQANVSPAIAPTVEELPTGDPARRVLVFTVIATGRAHALRDGAQSAWWVRVDHQTKEARNGVLMRLLAARGEVEPWDRRIANDATVDDLDLLALRETLVRMGSWDPAREVDHWLNPDVSISTYVPPLCGREKLSGVIRPRNFALLLFGREPQRFVAGAVSSFSRYPGFDRAEPYSERTLIDGTILHQAQRLLDRLHAEAVMVTDKSTGGDENLQKYPFQALQEAVINALVHRDYATPDPVRVVSYTDRIEIWSPGGLDHRLNREAFLRSAAHPVWRNQALAWVFIKLQLAQSEGRGITAIQRSLASAGSPPATFELTDHSVVCVLPAHPRHGRVRDLLRVEADLAQGRIAAALAALSALLTEDPHNVRTLALLAEVARVDQDPTPVMRFLDPHRAALRSFPAVARLTLAGALLVGEPGAEQHDLARALLADLDLWSPSDLRRQATLLLACQDAPAALAALQSAFDHDPSLSEDPHLLHLRGAAWLQITKRAHEGGAADDDPALRTSASHAARDLRASLAHGAAGGIKARVERDLRYLQDQGWCR